MSNTNYKVDIIVSHGGEIYKNGKSVALPYVKILWIYIVLCELGQLLNVLDYSQLSPSLAMILMVGRTVITGGVTIITNPPWHWEHLQDSDVPRYLVYLYLGSARGSRCWKYNEIAENWAEQ